MNATLTPLLVLGLLALAPRTQEADPPQPIEREGPVFRLVCHLPDEAAAERAFEAVQGVLPRAEALYGKLPRKLERKLVVHLYPNADAYRAADQALTGGHFQRNLAFAHIQSLSAHVALQPELVPETLERVGLPTQTLRLLAHEAAHLVRYAQMPNCDSHPGWLADGAASWIEVGVLQDMGLIDGLGRYPRTSTAILRVRRLLAEERPPTVQDVLLDRSGELDFYERYDLRWAVFTMLAEGSRRRDLRELVAETGRLGGGRDFTKRLYAIWEGLVQEKQRAALDEELREFVDEVEPEWDQVFRDLYSDGDAWVQAAFDSNAIAWRREPSGDEPYSVAGRLTLLPAARQQMNLFLGRSRHGFASVAFNPGGVTLFEYLSASSSWERRGWAECEAIAVGEAFAFEVTVDGPRVEVAVGGRGLLAGEVETLSLKGPWGLSAQAGSAGIWEIPRL